MKVYAFVPAKGTSERVENKNMRFLDGERLYIRALKKLLKCKNIDRVFLDTESQEMFDLVDYLPITFMKRDANLATNKTDGHQMFVNEVNSFPDADIYVQLLCTSPFINPETIDDAIEKLKASEVSAVKLTATEYGIVEHLMKNLGCILSTTQIYEAVWGEPCMVGDKTVTVHIRRIREKIEINPKDPKYLKVVWGIGYKIEKI